MEFEIDPPIQITGNANADQIGRSQANLHKMRYQATYKKQGYDVEVRYIVEDDLVRLFVNLTSSNHP